MPAKQTRKTPPLTHNGGSQAELLDQFLIHDDRPEAHDLAALSHSMDGSNPPALPSIYQYHDALQHSPTNSPHLSNLPLPNSASLNQMVPNLVMTASAANELSNILPMSNGLPMEPELNLSNTVMSDRYFQNQGRQQWSNPPPPSIDPLLHDHNKEQAVPKDDGLHTNVPQQRPIAMNPNGSQGQFTTDFSMSPKPHKPKVRGRFSDSRRKEVQEVRKRGACIRCRMLKKPCSGDNPCNTCMNVESARLWKQPCIRTRIAEEFNLYSAGLHTILAFHAIGQAKGQIRLDQTPGRIEASHYPESGTFATFTPLKCQTQAIANSDIDPAILASLSPSSLEIVDNDDDIGGKLDLYVRKVASSFHTSEESDFMKTTVEIALGVTVSNPDGLLTKVLELWNLSRILTSRDLSWHIFSNPSLAPTMAPSTMSSSDLENSSRTPITADNNVSSYDLIKMQLQGAIEKRAACLARVVMNDLERRLLQRQQANPFETFLVAVILLACVERMCWLFRTWEDPSSSATTDHDLPIIDHPRPSTDDSLAAALQSIPSSTSDRPATHTRHAKWPLDKLPAYYSQQGERFSDILNMLLKMRGVPPKPVARSSDSMLIMWGEDVDGKVREWYEGIAITTSKLAERSNAPFVGEDPREWELKYIGKIISGVN